MIGADEVYETTMLLRRMALTHDQRHNEISRRRDSQEAEFAGQCPLMLDGQAGAE